MLYHHLFHAFYDHVDFFSFLMHILDQKHLPDQVHYTPQVRFLVYRFWSLLIPYFLVLPVYLVLIHYPLNHHVIAVNRNFKINCNFELYILNYLFTLILNELRFHNFMRNRNCPDSTGSDVSNDIFLSSSLFQSYATASRIKSCSSVYALLIASWMSCSCSCRCSLSAKFLQCFFPSKVYFFFHLNYFSCNF